MALTTGTRLGSFEIISPLGAGGMGEVYRAHDTKLGRSVALKILPDSVATDPERVARFEREARVLASLNHPHIAALYGMEESGTRHFLLMELVEGKTLADVIREASGSGPVASPGVQRDSASGPERQTQRLKPEALRTSQHGLPIEQALSIARQIAEALEAAHEQGVVHRDLKPANVKITPDGQVKVLDFGLARAMDPRSGAAAAPGPADLSPTLSALATQAGVILGTASYMAPEQAKGLPADQRSDLFSFGVVFYEMLMGRAPFQGDTVADVLASVVAREADLSLLPSTLNPRLVELLQRCLEKNPRRRWQTATDLRADLEAIARSPRAHATAAPVVVQAPSRGRLALSSVLSAVVAASLTTGAMWLFRSEPAPLHAPTTRFSLALGEGQQFTNTGRHAIAISPDGSKIVYVANLRLYLRAMGDLEARPISGTETWGAVLEPVFSPDGLSIAFWAQGDGTLKKIGVTGGAAVTLCRVTAPYGLSWGADGLAFGQDPGGILRVARTGGQPEVLMRVKDGEIAHGPQVIANGQVVLFTLGTGSGPDRWDKAQIVTQSIRSGERRVVLTAGSDARYLPTGHLVYAVEGVVFAVPFDLSRMAVTGGGTPVIEGVRRSIFLGPVLGTAAAHLSVSATGSIVYLPGPVRTLGVQRDLAQVTRGGEVARLKLPPGAYLNPRYAPDGTRVAFDLNDGKADTISIYDLSGATAMRRLTLTGANRFPIWSPDSKWIAYQSDREGDLGIFQQRADGAGTAQRLTKPDPGTSHVPDGWSPDRRTLLFEALKDGVFSLWTLSLRDGKVERFGDLESREALDATFAPNGRWVAYDAGEGLATRVYVEPFPRTGARYLATNERGINPFWSPTGTELFYAPTADSFAAVAFAAERSVEFGNPAPVPRGGLTGTTSAARRTYDMSPDGKRIIGLIDAVTPQSTGAPAIQVVLNWFEELKARVH